MQRIDGALVVLVVVTVLLAILVRVAFHQLLVLPTWLLGPGW